jgi:hypothetical protein
MTNLCAYYNIGEVCKRDIERVIKYRVGKLASMGGVIRINFFLSLPYSFFHYCSLSANPLYSKKSLNSLYCYYIIFLTLVNEKAIFWRCLLDFIIVIVVSDKNSHILKKKRTKKNKQQMFSMQAFFLSLSLFSFSSSNTFKQLSLVASHRVCIYTI